MPEPLEPAQFRDLEVRVGHSPWSSRKISSLPVAFESRDGVDGDVLLIRSLQCAPVEEGRRQREPVEVPVGIRDLGRAACRSRLRSSAPGFEAKAERNFAPWSKTSSMGPCSPGTACCPRCRVAAPAAGRRAHADEALGHEAQLRVGDVRGGPLDLGELDLVRFCCPCAGSRRSRPCWG